MHHVMLNASTFSSPSLSFDYREHPSDNSHIFLSLRNKSAEELSVPVPCTLSSQHFTLPIMHSFSLQNKSSADPHTARPLFPLKHDIRHVRKWGETSKQTEESREQRFSLYLRPYFHISRHCTQTQESLCWHTEMGEDLTRGWLYLHSTAFLHLSLTFFFTSSYPRPQATFNLEYKFYFFTTCAN